jgi:hypothetical protein
MPEKGNPCSKKAYDSSASYYLDKAQKEPLYLSIKIIMQSPQAKKYSKKCRDHIHC